MDKITYKGFTICIEIDNESETSKQSQGAPVYRYQVINSSGDIENGCDGFIGIDHEQSGLLIDAKDYIDGLINKKRGGKFGYIAFYKGKKAEVYADTSFEAQKKAAEQFKAKKRYDVSVHLCEKDGKDIEHKADF